MKTRSFVLSILLTLLLTGAASAQDGAPLPAGYEWARYYQNGAPVTEGPLDYSGDVKRVAIGYWVQQLVSYADGYLVEVPLTLEWDFTLANKVVKASSADFSVTISRERSPYADIDYYIDFYQNRFYTSESFRTANSLVLEEDLTITAAGYETKVITLRYTKGGLPYDVYTFAYQKTGGTAYTRYLFRGKNFNESYVEMVRDVLNSYQAVGRRGTAASTLSPSPRGEALWNAETMALYRRYLYQDTLDWGIFVQDMYNTGVKETIPALEAEIGTPFEVVLMYHQLGTPLELEGMRAAAEAGKVIELTIQVCHNNNQDVYGYTPMLDLVAGRLDEQIRQMASQLKEFGHPVLFRLNNEMNSDWTSYSGIVTLSDPELYIRAWQHIYKLFYRENVRNTIWIFNPNDRNYPPSNWNDFSCYWPGEHYVHMIGVTGYNTGDYYRNLTGETWREFKTIYDEIERHYLPLFGEYPWIITEFASSSYGGNKVRWIDNMFRDLPGYKNIKVAVWWSYADYDLRPGREHIAARPYFLDETADTLQAFARGRSGDG